MTSKILSVVPTGFTGQLITIEGDSSRGLPHFSIVGMANKTIDEARHRVRSAIINSGFSFPDSKLTVNLAPAELHKDGPHLDLPIALTILTLSQQLLPTDTASKLFVGELSLTGEIKPVRGIINIIEIATKHHFSEIIVPTANLPQASLIPGVKITGADTLQQLYLHLKQIKPIQNPTISKIVKNTTTDTRPIHLDHIRGQAIAKRALTIAIAGHHNILLAGPPGAGKSMLAKSALSLLPPLSLSEQISVTKLHSICGNTDQIITRRPFRNPHHSASPIAILGGGAKSTPGEVSLAHLGVLYLDEIPEFPRPVIESLRGPIEDKTITLARAVSHITYPTDFMLIATMNPCPCGYFGSPEHDCKCTATQILNYQKKLSGPILDRIDIYLDLPRVDISDLAHTTNSTVEHDHARAQVAQARAIQHQRYSNSTTNSSLSSHQIHQLLHLSTSAQSLLQRAANALDLTARSYFKTIKIAQTIADLEQADSIQPPHISEALQYRKRD